MAAIFRSPFAALRKSTCLAILSILLTTTNGRGDEAGKKSDNPVLPGWHAAPEAVVFGKEY